MVVNMTAKKPKPFVLWILCLRLCKKGDKFVREMNMLEPTCFKFKRMKTEKQIISLLQEPLYKSGLGTSNDS